MKDLSKVLFITDMDGTLLPTNKKLNNKDLAAINKFKSCGGHFSVATGRSLQSASQYFDELELSEPIILCNGGGIYDCKKGDFSWQRFVDNSAYNTVKKVFGQFPYLGGEVTFSDCIRVPRMSKQEKHHLDISYGDNYVEVPYDKLPKDGWCKMLFAAEENEIPLIIEYVEQLNNDKLEYVRSSKLYYEILPKNCSKGKALEIMKELYSLNDWKIVACGDFDNDLEMLEFADIGFAPENAQACVKAAADYVTAADCNNGAVAQALESVMNVL